MDEKEHYVELIRIFDKMIAEGNWEGGLFFQVAGNKLKDFRDQLKKKINIDTGNSEPTPAEMANYIKQRSGLIEVYIALYSAEGNNLRKWEVVLSNLTRQLVNRPIYKREKDIQDIIKTKENPINDAYAIAYVSETDIIKFSAHDKPVLHTTSRHTSSDESQFDLFPQQHDLQFYAYLKSHFVVDLK